VTPASAIPTAPPKIASTALSVMSNLASRFVPAPSATRTASSRRRASPRTSKRPGDVRTRDEQHQHDRTENDEQHRSHASRDLFLDRNDERMNPTFAM
jgi:hypothetical protein